MRPKCVDRCANLIAKPLKLPKAASSSNILSGRVVTHFVERQVAPSHCSQSRRCPLIGRSSHPVEGHTETPSPWSVWKDRIPPRIANRLIVTRSANVQGIHMPSIRRHCHPYCETSRDPPRIPHIRVVVCVAKCKTNPSNSQASSPSPLRRVKAFPHVAGCRRTHGLLSLNQFRWSG